MKIKILAVRILFMAIVLMDGAFFLFNNRFIRETTFPTREMVDYVSFVNVIINITMILMALVFLIIYSSLRMNAKKANNIRTNKWLSQNDSCARLVSYTFFTATPIFGLTFANFLIRVQNAWLFKSRESFIACIILLCVVAALVITFVVMATLIHRTFTDINLVVSAELLAVVEEVKTESEFEFKQQFEVLKQLNEVTQTSFSVWDIKYSAIIHEKKFEIIDEKKRSSNPSHILFK